MRERAAKAHCAPSCVRDHRFWDEVEREVEAPDCKDLAEFLEADLLPVNARSEFFEELQEELRALVRARYCT
jgi:hypothetical protein